MPWPAVSGQPERERAQRSWAAQLAITPVEAAQLTVGEVCTVSGGTIVVLAAQDGPLRLANGDYLLLNPATNPPEN